MLPAGRSCRYAGQIFTGVRSLARDLARADAGGFPRNTAWPVRALRGFLSRYRGEVLFSSPGSHSEHRVLLTLLERQGVVLRELRGGLTLQRFPERWWQELEQDFGLTRRELRQRLHLRRPRLRDFAQRLRDGVLHGPALQEAALSLALAPQAEGPTFPARPGGNLRLACLGSPLQSSWLRWLEARGIQVVLTDESLAELAGAVDTPEELLSSFPFSWQSQQERFQQAGDWCRQLGVRGALFLMSPLSHESLEYEACRPLLPCPVLPLEVQGPGAPDRRNRLRIDAFLERIA